MEVGGGEGDYIPIATLSTPEYSCIKMGSDESHFNASLIVRDSLQTTTFFKKRRAEAESIPGPSAYC